MPEAPAELAGKHPNLERYGKPLLIPGRQQQHYYYVATDDSLFMFPKP